MSESGLSFHIRNTLVLPDYELVWGQCTHGPTFSANLILSTGQSEACQKFSRGLPPAVKWEGAFEDKRD